MDVFEEGIFEFFCIWTKNCSEMDDYVDQRATMVSNFCCVERCRVCLANIYLCFLKDF